jgi:hypothetical protein
MGVPALSYRATINPDYDEDFYLLPNRLSHPCFNFKELVTMLQDIVAGVQVTSADAQHQALLDRYLTALDGPLACERIVDVCERLLDEEGGFAKSTIKARVMGRIKANRRARRKQTKSKRSGSHLKSDFQRHRYPEIATEEIYRALSRFQKILGNDQQLKIKRLFKHSFRIS